MKRINVLLLALTVFVFFSAAYGDPLEVCKEHVTYGAPSTKPALLCRLGYLLAHDAQHKLPNWVAYHVTREHIQMGNVPRSDDFRPDPDLDAGSRSELKDYKRSGFDRGHMAPAAAFKWSERTMSESFLLSNMAPQVGIGFNRHIWARLEANVRTWAVARGELYVITGPIYDPAALKQIGTNKVSVPSHFYKVIFDPIRVEAIAFILPNKKLQTSQLPTFIVNVDHVEAKSGLDFLAGLEDSVEALVEAKTQPAMW